MSETPKPVGSISWTDLTVTDADRVRDFYQAVVGWSHTPVAMGDYDDYCMNTPGDGQTVAGICHAQGANEGLPAQWLVYITVENLDASIQRCESLGGKVLHGPREMGGARFAVIQDPAGACAGLYQPEAC